MNVGHLMNTHNMCTEYVNYKIGKEWMEMVSSLIELKVKYVLIIKYRWKYNPSFLKKSSCQSCKFKGSLSNKPSQSV